MRYRLMYLLAGLSTLVLAGVAAARAETLRDAATRAVALVQQGKFDAARKVLRKAVAGRPDAPLHLAELEGLILRKEGRESEAIEVFRFILSRQPNFTPARIELSRALAATGADDAALHQLQIIELGSDDPQVRREARAFSDSVKDSRPYGFSGYVSVLPSTNVNKGSGQTTFKVGDMEFVIDDASREQSGVGVGLGGNAYRRVYLGAKTQLTWNGAIDLKKYSASDDYDELAFSTNLALSRRFGRVQLQIGPVIDYRLLAWQPYALRYGAAVGGTVDASPHTRFYAGATFLKQDFVSQDYRDGWTSVTYVALRHAFSPSLAATLSGNFIAERTRRDYLDHNDVRLVAQIDREWSGGLITSVAAGIGYDDYVGDFPGTATARYDRVWNAGLTVTDRNFSFGGFAPQFSYQYTRQQSNISFYDYDSHDFDVTLTKRF